MLTSISDSPKRRHMVNISWARVYFIGHTLDKIVLQNEHTKALKHLLFSMAQEFSLWNLNFYSYILPSSIV